MTFDPKAFVDLVALRAQQQEQEPPRSWVNMSVWDNTTVPQRDWHIRDRIPVRQPTLFSGEGAIGKSLVILHLLAATALGRDWCGMIPELGGAWYIGAEDDERELHIRLEEIRQHFGVKYADLIEGGFKMMSLFSEDAVLAAPDRRGIIQPTSLFQQLHDEAQKDKPSCIALDASADMFAGDEIDRAQVRQFIGLLRMLAAASDGSVILLSHPSLTGISSGSGISGSTAWHNSVRARMYLTAPKPEAGEQPDSDLRELTFKKNQYGPPSDSIILRYRNGLFLPEPGTSSLETAAAEQTAKDVFLTLLAKFSGQGRNLSHKERSNNYAPRVFSTQPEAKGLVRPQRALAAAMEQLFREGKIHVHQYNRFGHERLAIGPAL